MHFPYSYIYIYIYIYIYREREREREGLLPRCPFVMFFMSACKTCLKILPQKKKQKFILF